jgi:hypothetical protein
LVVGWSHNADEVDRAVIWDATSVNEIPLPADGNPARDMRAYGMNDNGVAVGYYFSTATGSATAFYYDGADAHSLGPALVAAGLTGGYSYARDVNNSGLICGEAQDAASDYAFFTYDIDTGIVTVLGKLSPFPGTGYFTIAMNEAGHVVGRGRTLPWDPTIHALLHDGAFHVIDDAVTDAQWAADIADNGRMVGYTGSGGDRWSWYADSVGTGTMRPVDLPGWLEISVRGVNDRGQMAGSGLSPTSGETVAGFIVSPPPGDGDHDGDVDIDDYTLFADCLGGPNGSDGFVAPTAACLAAFDFVPSDGDVDIGDYGAFQAAMAASQP